MAILGVLASVTLIVAVLVDVFEVMLLPRRVNHRRLTRLFYRAAWGLWWSVGRHRKPGKRRETYLSVFGPLSLLALLATWGLVLLFGFALLHWSLGTPLQSASGPVGFWGYWYFSGITFFTVGYGDFFP